MKIAIIGTGISGNVAAYHLNRYHDITVYEMNNYSGGHTHTHDLALKGHDYAVDSGFIVFNYKTYPLFTKLLKQLEVEVQPSAMTFSVKCEKTGLEYNGTTLNTLFSQRSNILKPSFYRMIKDILRFNRKAVDSLNTKAADETLGDFLFHGNYSREFIEHYLVPMGAAVWSADPEQMMSFPAGFFIRFFHNHGLLSVDGHASWYVIKGGSREYVKKLTASFAHLIQHETRVDKIYRHEKEVEIRLSDGSTKYFDQVVIATHSDQALNILGDASEKEKDILGAIPYQENEAILHTDESILPKHKRAWAAWNYHILKKVQNRVALTYNMNILQGIKSEKSFCVTLNNADAIEPSMIIKRIKYEHPVFTPEAVAAQQRQSEINGVKRTYFCGAYWRYGFHEDGVWSALNAIDDIARDNDDQLLLRRAG